MNCRKWLFVLCVLALPVFVFSQSANSPLQALLTNQQSVAVNWQNKYISITDTPFNTFPQNLLETKDGLYVFVNGSGRLYQLENNGKGILPQRVDSTIFFGYNFGSFPFIYHDTIYSLGGYGMWRINGQLRTYIPQAHSWDIVPLNEEVPVLMQDDNHNLLWYDEKNAKLYIAYSIQRNQAVKKDRLNDAGFDYTVRCLDLKTKEWTETGALNDYFKDKVALLRDIAFTPWGQLAAFGNKLVLIDYRNNKLLHLTENTENRIRPILFQDPNTNLYYCVDSTLYFGNIAENRLASLSLHKNDFIVSDIPVYTKLATPNTPFIIIGGVLSLLLITGFVVAWKRKRKAEKAIDIAPSKPTHINNNEDAVAASHGEPVQVQVKPTDIFNEKELRVIQLITDNSRRDMPTSTDELNRILGLTNASSDSQKSQRSKLFKSINERYSHWKKNEDLIESRSQQGDGRYKEYFIAACKLAELDAACIELSQHN